MEKISLFILWAGLAVIRGHALRLWAHPGCGGHRSMITRTPFTFLICTVLLATVVGCNPPGTDVAALQQQIERLQADLARERALRAIDEIRHIGRLSSEGERLLDGLLRSELAVHRSQGSAVLVVAVQRDPAYLPIALEKVAQVRHDDYGHWTEVEKILRRAATQ